MVNMHIFYCGVCTLGCFLQQFTLYRESILYKIPFSPTCIQKSSCLLLMFVIGLCLEIISLVFLPFITYMIISTSHLLFFKIQILKDHENLLKKSEKAGLAAIATGCMVTSISGAVNQKFTKAILDPNYFMCSVISILALFTMRRLGFYNSKAILDTCIPSQLSTISTGMLKMGVYVVYSNALKDIHPSAVFLSVFLIFTLFGLSISFTKVFIKQYDIVVVHGGYQMWNLIWSLPVSVLFIDHSSDYSYLHLGFILIGFIITLSGVLILTYDRVEHLKTSVENKNIVLPPARSQLDAAPVPAENASIELSIEDENLIDAELIDEDMLIKTIRNL